MATNLDKSLDEIIKSKPRHFRQRKAASSATVRKSQGPKTRAKKAAAPSKTKAEKPASVPLDEAALLADRIILRNIPLDIDETSVKQYFADEIGHVKSCQATYTSKGNRTGEFQLVFGKPGRAAAAVNKFNGTTVDNGKRVMKVELVVDPTRKPLSARLKKPVAPAPTKPAKEQPRKVAAKKKPTKKRGSARRGKKSLEELDAEMTDYFKDDSAPAAATA